MNLRTLLLCLLLAGCGSGGDEPVVVCEKDDVACETQQYAPTKQHYGEQK